MKIYACCFNDEELKQFIISSAKEKVDCPYCGSTSESVDISEVLDFFFDFFSVFSKDEKGTAFSELIQQDWNLFSNDTNVQEILTEILQQLTIDLKITDKVSYLQEITKCVGYWDILKEDLKWNKRFFLADVDRFMELGWDFLLGVYSIIDSNNKFYRARIHKDGNKKLFGKDELGCPQKEYSVGGRANPQGIPYLYLCNDIDTTFYETRVSYLDIVSVGTFQLKEKEILKIVDFTQWQSPFNAYNEYANMIGFVQGKLLRQRISKDLSKPMRRFDSEMEYLPTQFICEFVRYVVGATGIQFSSSLRNGGINVVLFEPEDVQCIDEQLYQINGIEIRYEEILADT